MSNEPLPPRPKLENEPVAFITVKQTAAGAVFGAVVSSALQGFDMIFHKTTFSGRTLAGSAALVAAIAGGTSYINAKIINRERDITRPYVKRLEQEVLAKNPMPDTPQR